MHTTATDARTLFTYHFLIVSSVINHIIIPLRNRFAFLQFSPGGSDSFLYVLVCMRRIRSYPRICLLTGRYGDIVARVLWRPRGEAKTRFAFLQFSPGGSDSFLYVLVCLRRIRSYPRIWLLTGRYGDTVARVLWRPRNGINSVNATYICAQLASA